MKSRQDSIRRILMAAEGPIGPTEIARRVNEGWCWSEGKPGIGYPLSAQIYVELLRMGDVARVGKGLYYLIRRRVGEVK